MWGIELPISAAKAAASTATIRLRVTLGAPPAGRRRGPAAPIGGSGRTWSSRYYQRDQAPALRMVGYTG
ncbi:hypothetical protein ONR57_18070 [Hoyosella sp. YIM 151337]|uniref:hypothetical protein n=1 Tax=Hoyosella sp. YIM 151337 TaxID=2992742 RepID=UPI0022362255|nr:hypothetical protein [Hoyosella sp. YIM 151337]MCW4355214.1 hypothetical protein [Hoyosella sp. YIM 151337]